MVEVYWVCLIVGLLFSVVTVVFGDVFSNVLDGLLDFMSFDFLNPMVIVSFVTIFGGSGVLLSEYTTVPMPGVALLSVSLALVLCILIYFFYVKPMGKAQNSLGFSIQDLNGNIGEVTIPIPIDGYGEVMVRIGGGRTYQIAKGFNKEAFPTGARVVVIDVKNATLLVSHFDEFNLESGGADEG